MATPENWQAALSNLFATSRAEQEDLNMHSYPIDEVENRPVHFVQGAKGVGKSTFSKLLVNTLLSQ